MKTQITLLACFAVSALLSFSSLSCIHAQSTYNLEPTFENLLVACAEADEDGDVKIIYASARHQTVADEMANENEPKMGDEKKPTAMKSETYIVMVPVQEMEKVDGKMVTKVVYREEQRTRMVPVNGTTERTGIYTVQVPVTQQKMVGGKKVDATVMTTQTRTRTIKAGQKLVADPSTNELVLKADSLQFFLANGTSLDNAAGVKRMRERVPVIFVGKDGMLNPFYRQLVRPDTLLIYDKNKTLYRRLTSKAIVDPPKKAGSK